MYELTLRLALGGPAPDETHISGIDAEKPDGENRRAYQHACNDDTCSSSTGTSSRRTWGESSDTSLTIARCTSRDVEVMWSPAIGVCAG